jgi:antitoxin HicB
MRFAVIFAPDDNGALLVTCPDLPEVTTFGEDEDDALLHAEDAIMTALTARIADREPIPVPRAQGRLVVTLPALVSAKVALYQAMLDDGVRKAELARRLNWKLPQIDRVLDLDHGSRLDQVEAALAALGRRLELKVRRAA